MTDAQKQSILERVLEEIRSKGGIVPSAELAELTEYSCSAVDAPYIDCSQRQDH